MYDLVNDIKNYNEFLPWCKSVKIHSQSRDRVIATLYVSKGKFDLQFTTINKLIKNNSIIMCQVNKLNFFGYMRTIVCIH